MRTLILAAVAVAALGVSSAFAEGEGGPTAGGLEWQAANGNPTIPATEWFAMTTAAREARVQQLQQQAAAALWPGLTQNGHAVAQGNANPRG
jgi:hypothetical protein